jgi:hypothetical protein
LYATNNTMVSDFNAGKSAVDSYSFINSSYGQTGVFPPMDLTLGTTSGGSLVARSYFGKATHVDVNGAETPACSYAGPSNFGLLAGFYGPGTMVNVPANSVATSASPLARTGAHGWNDYLGFPPPPPATLSQVAAGSLAATKYYFSLTFLNAIGESLNLCAFPYYFTQGSFSSGDNNTYEQAISCAVNTVPKVTSPTASPYSITSWGSFYGYPSVTITPYGTTHYNVYGGTESGGETLQNSSPIPIGTDWTMPTTGLVNGPLMQQGWIKQNASPIAMGTAFQEANTGPVSAAAPTLVWRQRASAPSPAPGPGAGNAALQEFWAPASGALSGHVINVVFNSNGGTFGAAFGVAGAGIDIAAPFDTNAALPSEVSTGASTTISTSSGHALIIGAFVDLSGGTGTAGSGFTQIMGGSGDPAGGVVVIEAKAVATAQTNLPVNTTNASTDQNVIGDAIAGTGTMSIDGIVKAAGTYQNLAQFQNFMTLPALTTANADDIIVFVTTGGVGSVANIDAPGPPLFNATVGGPIVVAQNNYLVNFSGSSGNYVANPASGGTGTTTLTDNTICDPLEGGGPEPGFVDQSGYNYGLMTGAAAIGAGTNPGSTPEGDSLVPVHQLELFGTPTPGTVIATAVSRTDSGIDLGAFQHGI